MTSRYDRKLDRLISHHGIIGQCGNGMHNFVIDEIELGARVALAIDEPEQALWEIVLNKGYEKWLNSNGGNTSPSAMTLSLADDTEIFGKAIGLPKQ